MAFDYDDPYETVSLIFQRATEKAVRVETRDGAMLWTPRSLLHAVTDRQLNSATEGSEFDFQVRSWFCKKEALV